jgi:serine protease Do
MIRWPPIAVLAAAGCAVLPAQALEREALVRLGASMIRVEAPRDDGGLAFGSGVAVARDTVVTNCHVTRDARRIVVIHAGQRHAVDSQASDLANDLCLLRAPGLDATPVALGRSNELAPGQPLAALGYTGGAGLSTSAGSVVQLHRFKGARVVQTSSHFTSGASGGGLFDDRGALVGVLTFRLRGGLAHYFASPAEWVARLLAAPAFVRVAPLAAEPAPYWAASGAAQPRFLEAAALMQSMRWDQLATTARAWLRAEPADAEPWVALGIALLRLEQAAEGRRALECALRLEPAHPVARDWLSRTASAGAATTCDIT